MLRPSTYDFHLSDGVRLNVHSWEAESSQAVLVCVQGLGGHGAYYSTLAEVLDLMPVSIVAPDLRGHGLSEGTRGDIASFETYLSDLAELFSDVRKRHGAKPIIFFGESMGAVILLNYLMKYRPDVQGVVLLSPVLRPTVRPTLGEVGRFLSYALYNPIKPAMRLRGREDLGSRDELFNQQLKQDQLFVEKASVRFLFQLNLSIWRARRSAEALTMPFLVLIGEDDRVTDHRKTMRFYERIPAQHKLLVEFPTGFHALLNDPVKTQVADTLTDWLKEYSLGRS